MLEVNMAMSPQLEWTGVAERVEVLYSEAYDRFVPVIFIKQGKSTRFEECRHLASTFRDTSITKAKRLANAMGVPAIIDKDML